jgi:sugar/nucleoside kinase (ribokinase family)
MLRDISVVGVLNLDLIIKGAVPPGFEAMAAWNSPAQMQILTAGAIGYTVQNLAKLGLRVGVSSCVSADPLGAYIVDVLYRAGVDTELIQQIPDTLGGIGVYLLLFGSRKRPLIYRLPTHPLWPLDLTLKDTNCLLDARALHCGGYLHYQAAWHGTTQDLFREAKARGLITSLDPQFPVVDLPPPWLPALTDLLPFIDLLFCDEDEALKLTDAGRVDDAADELLAAGAKTVIIKRGAEGSSVYQAGLRHQQTALAFGAVEDTIGAGDAYDAGFLYGALHDWPLPECALFGSIVAGYSVTEPGGAPSDLPDLLAQMEHYR